MSISTRHNFGTLYVDTYMYSIKRPDVTENATIWEHSFDIADHTYLASILPMKGVGMLTTSRVRDRKILVTELDDGEVVPICRLKTRYNAYLLMVPKFCVVYSYKRRGTMPLHEDNRPEPKTGCLTVSSFHKSRCLQLIVDFLSARFHILTSHPPITLPQPHLWVSIRQPISLKS